MEQLRLNNYKCKICKRSVYIYALYVLSFGWKKSKVELAVRCRSYKTNSKCRLYGIRSVYIFHNLVFLPGYEKNLADIYIDKNNSST